MSLLLESSATNATFETRLCQPAYLEATDLIVSCATSNLFTVPSCLASAPPTMTTLQLILPALIPSFAVFPPSLRSLWCSGCYFAPSGVSGPGATNDFDDNGEIVWEQVWPIFPNLTELELGGSLKSLKG